MNSKTPTTDPRANKDYGILSMGYFSTCAADHDENSPPYFDCQDSGVVMETTNQRVENDFSDLSEDDIIGCAAVEANGSDDFFDRLKAGHKIKFEKQIINAFKHYAGNLEKRWLVFLYGLDDLLNYVRRHIILD